MPTVNVTADEKKVIRFLEKQFLAIGGKPITMRDPVTTAEQVMKECGLDETSYRRIITRLEYLQFAKAVRPGNPDEWVKIFPSITDAVHQFDNPPVKDHLADLKKKAFSRWWFVLIVLAVAGLACAATIIANLQTLLHWFGIPK